MDRLLLFTGIGGTGVLAQFLRFAFDRRAAFPRDRLSRLLGPVFGYTFVIIHCVGAPIGLPLRAAFPLGPTKFLDQFRVRTPLDPSVDRQDVVIVNAPNQWLAGFLPVHRMLDRQAVPRHTRVLAPALRCVTVFRPDDRTLLIRSDKGFASGAMDRGLRDDTAPFALGERVSLTGLAIEVTALAADGRPAEAAFRFADRLEDPSLRWLQWREGHFVPFVPPAIGQTIELRQPVPALWPLRRGGPATEIP